jgi:uncharacterized protein
MPIINNTTYRPPRWQFNPHIQTIYPSLLRKVRVNYQRERVELPDGDFLDLDWSFYQSSISSLQSTVSSLQSSTQNPKSEIVYPKSKNLVIVTHGLEGDSTRHYVTGMIHKFNQIGFDGLGWNCRSCSGEMNRLPRFYHHGDIEDIRFVVNHAVQKGYKKIVLVGFSMGGSMTLRLLGEKPETVPNQVVMGIAASVPLDLFTSVFELYKSGRRFYMKRFIDKLGVKIKAKSKLFPDHPIINHEGYEKITNFEEFDNRYTAPLYGFRDAHDFYRNAGAKPFLKNIQKPAYIFQAINDPFLSPECLDLGDAIDNTNVHLELLQYGGHVGFMMPNSNETYIEQMAGRLVQKIL